ncbi:hypothetical protein COL08_22950 [Priestia megaterium]|uniref:HNH endonuclease n=1 Tax=Priestia megaterium TaxID=1404 RepID=UPI000BFA7AF5|nr:HNH endonuclease [Priestia megaterium]PFV93055.1 hypothetical protein COL08_22950 [Priestia megaterium]
MSNKNGFIKWLTNNTTLSSTTILKYANAINTISLELRKYQLIHENLYDNLDSITVKAILTKYLSIPELKDKDIRGNRMYSNALKYFTKFSEYHDYNAQIQKELVIEKIGYEKYLKENYIQVINDINIVDRIEKKPTYKTVNNKKIWSRDPLKARDTVAAADYLCEVNNHHQYFISKFNFNNYVEAHHLIPMKYQQEFDCSLDVYANIVSLCLVCHKQLHYGLFEEKKELLSKLFTDRKDRLLASGIDITINDLYGYYRD